jgi:cyclopropane-fatty-acyl-phospholipid synthase
MIVLMRLMVSALERGYLPDGIIRLGMRFLLWRSLKEFSQGSLQQRQERLMKFVEHMRQGPIAIHTQEANQQHYEVPTEFFQYCLGTHLKYSGCLFQTPQDSLDQAEEAMLELYLQRAQLIDGQQVLELGCGWGSLTLFMAKRFPNSRITAVSNSVTQKAYIYQQAQLRGIGNITVITCDINQLELEQRFDRIVSVEMFEHMRNWGALFEKVGQWLAEEGKFFLHIFTHRQYAYYYESNNPLDFIGRYFFTGGIMPSDQLPLYFQQYLRIVNHWHVDGMHYSLTAREWLKNMDKHQDEIMPLLASVYGQDQALKWWHYWRVFYMACEELWGYRLGQEWLVSHYLFVKNQIRGGSCSS